MNISKGRKWKLWLCSGRINDNETMVDVLWNQVVGKLHWVWPGSKIVAISATVSLPSLAACLRRSWGRTLMLTRLPAFLTINLATEYVRIKFRHHAWTHFHDWGIFDDISGMPALREAFIIRSFISGSLYIKICFKIWSEKPGYLWRNILALSLASDSRPNKS